jgi:hypothetical protein
MKRRSSTLCDCGTIPAWQQWPEPIDQPYGNCRAYVAPCHDVLSSRNSLQASSHLARCFVRRSAVIPGRGRRPRHAESLSMAHIHREAEGGFALVVELVEEPTLADCVARGPITVRRSPATCKADRRGVGSRARPEDHHCDPTKRSSRHRRRKDQGLLPNERALPDPEQQFFELAELLRP